MAGSSLRVQMLEGPVRIHTIEISEGVYVRQTCEGAQGQRHAWPAGGLKFQSPCQDWPSAKPAAPRSHLQDQLSFALHIDLKHSIHSHGPGYISFIL